MKLSLRTKVVGLTAGAAILPLAVMLVLTAQLQSRIAERAGEEVKVQAKASLGQAAKDAYALCEMTNALMKKDDRPESIQALRQAMLKVRVGQSGYVVIIGAKGALRGRYILSKNGERDGEDIWEVRDAQGRYVVQPSVNAALSRQPGELFYDEYLWKLTPESAPRKKVAAFMYYAPWDWLINVGTFEDEFQSATDGVQSELHGLVWKLILAGLGLVGLALVTAWLLCGRLTRPIALTAELAKKVAAGNLQEAKQQFAGDLNRDGADVDETGQLVDAFRSMADSLDSLIGQVRRSGIQVTASATQIAASARQLEATVAEQAASTKEVTATTRQITSTAGTLLDTMETVSETAAAAGTQAEKGNSELTRMENAMRQLMKATSSISTKLGIISDRANKITSVITTINKISDQTGLLALNAAIEAEKAGEYGKGFSVVAREISRLADQTAIATQDIENVVREMQSSVSGGVMEMDKFAEEVRQRAAEVGTVGQKLNATIDQVRALGPQFDAVKEGMNAQTQSAQQISEAMGQLSTGAEQTRESLHEFKSATEQLNAAVQGLQAEVARFKISA